MIETLSQALAHITWIEILAFILSIAYVILAAYENNWCWLAAAIASALYIYINIDAKLYSETGLQVFYLVMAFYGWWKWRNTTGDTKSFIITSFDLKAQLPLLAAGTILTALLYFIIKTYTDAALPLPDAFVTGFSLVATFMVARKILENWIWWVVIDAITIYIYFSRNYQLSAVLYFIYVIIAVAGYIKWKKDLSRQEA